MARLTEKQLKKLTANIKFKGKIIKPTPRWTPGNRQAKREAKAWKQLLGDRLPPTE